MNDYSKDTFSTLSLSCNTIVTGLTELKVNQLGI